MKDDDIEKLNEFLKLVNFYMERLIMGDKLSDLVSALSDEILVYEYSKFDGCSDLKSHCLNITSDYDIKNNKYALSYAASRFYNTFKTGNKKIDEYILKMK